MGGGGSETTTQTSGSTNPMVDSTVTKLLGGLQTQIDNGTAVFDKSLYPGLSSTTTGALTHLAKKGFEGKGGLDSAYNWANGVVKSGGYNPALTSAQDVYRNDISRSGYNAGLSTAQQGVQQYLRESQANAPGYAQLRAKAGQDTLNDVNGIFTGSGRFGSGSHVGNATEELGNVYAGMDMQNYENRLARMLGGNQALAGIAQTAHGNVANSTAGLAGVGQTAMGNAAGAAAAVPGLWDATLNPGRNELAVGQLLDADALATRQGENDLFRRSHDAGWTTLGQASSILAGTAGSGQQQTATTTPTAPWWQSMLGGALGGLGAFF
jgi:hypothetical protein